jgi:hypothetical protein
MTNSKNGDKKEKIPYEPPRLFNLGGGVAYAAVECKTGGSPAGQCKDGTMATSGRCKPGGVAGGNEDCKTGGIPEKKCKQGATK